MIYEYITISNSGVGEVNRLAEEGWEVVSESEYHYTLRRAKKQ